MVGVGIGGGGRSRGFRSGIKGSHAAVGNGGFARMHEDEEQRPIKLADMGGPLGGSVETRVRASGGRGGNAGGRGIYAGGGGGEDGGR